MKMITAIGTEAGRKTVKRALLAASLGLSAGLALFAITGTAEAQYFQRGPFFGGVYYGRFSVPVPREPVQLATSDIMSDLTDQGYRGLTLVSRRGDVLVIEGTSPRRMPVRLIVDAYDGEVLEHYALSDRADRKVATAPIEPKKREQAKTPKPEAKVADLPNPPRRPVAAPAPLAPAIAPPLPTPPLPTPPAAASPTPNVRVIPLSPTAPAAPVAPPVTETKPPVAEIKPPMAEVKPPVAEPKPIAPPQPPASSTWQPITIPVAPLE